MPRYDRYTYDGLASLHEQKARDWLNPRRMWRFDPAKLTILAQEVRSRRLDDFGLSPDVVKIDVQGAEIAVVRGGIETFRRSQPIAIIEASSIELVDLLGDLGMKPYRCEGRRLWEDWQGSKNVMFLTDQRRKALES